MTAILRTIPSPTKIREDLEQMVLKDLLGPVEGPEEEIDEPSVRDRYLVGMLAPKRQELSPEEFDELPNGGSGSVEDGASEPSSPTTKTMFPSSFGMTFCVGHEAKALQVTARWGHYHRDRSQTLTVAGGDKKLVWKRNQRNAVSEPIPLKPRKIQWVPDAEFPEVQIQGLVRKRDHFWSVTLFLINGQQEPKKLRDKAWLFQPELVVESPDQRPVFHSRPQQEDPGKSDPVSFAEEQEMAMLYRHQVEFGVGHGVSLHADCHEGVCDRAHRLATRVVPSYEVPQITPPIASDWPKLAGVVLDMKELGETPTPALEGKLRPLLTAYASWIEERKADLQTPDMALYQSPGQSVLERCRETLGRIEAGIKLLLDDEKAAEAFRFANLAMWQQRIHTIVSLKRRGLTALLVSCVRLRGIEFNANKKASKIDRNHDFVKSAIKTILRRAEEVGNSSGDKSFIPTLESELNDRLDNGSTMPRVRRVAGCLATTISGMASRPVC